MENKRQVGRERLCRGRIVSDLRICAAIGGRRQQGWWVEGQGWGELGRRGWCYSTAWYIQALFFWTFVPLSLYLLDGLLE